MVNGNEDQNRKKLTIINAWYVKRSIEADACFRKVCAKLSSIHWVCEKQSTINKRLNDELE